MTDAQDVTAKINTLLDVSARSLKFETADGYQELQNQIGDLEGLAREAFQARLENMYWPILAKLEDGQPLTAAEQDILELLMVGEAKYYLASENDADTWRAELERLLDEVEKLRALGLDEIDALMRLRALCREAMRVLPDLTYYFREKERVRKFNEATNGAIDAGTRRLLANLIKEMIESDKF